MPKLEDQPWPAFPADLMSIAIVTATQCDGVILMFEKCSNRGCSLSTS